MNLYTKVSAYIVITLMWFGVIIPSLVSAASDLAVAGAVVAGIVYPVFTYKYFKTEIDNLKGKF